MSDANDQKAGGAPFEGNERDRACSPHQGRRFRSATVRGLVAAAVFAVVAVGLALPTGTGTLSSMGWDAIAAVCPLGALESLFGAWAFVPRALIALAAIVLIVVIAGKAFCSWVCPIPHVQSLFKTKRRAREEAVERNVAADAALGRWRRGEKPARPKVAVDSRHAVLGGALLSTAVFGFPVFCLVCPVGLTFAAFILLWRFVQFNEPTWGLLAFPAIIVLEVAVLRKWCGRICPLGALLSLVSTFNRRFRPTVDSKACLRDAEGVGCKACAQACPELIDPYADLGNRPMTECVKCRSCADACPTRAITLPFRAARRAETGGSLASGASGESFGRAGERRDEAHNGRSTGGVRSGCSECAETGDESRSGAIDK
ncbi:hypothetical protein B5F40_06455 [Gordonibacter sp. An230]|uniref:4Fe-4S binding protein n=1 Tax=Gordonibacter sp. An230 TaxID=1965592 RepID=UPI000B370C8A|nr:4Fe-4S binding protein [Gordonibacter sp. An230]OUO90594.1 hypothetical protein B5F40_06455 [Gordonibacter sp. An230]